MEIISISIMIMSISISISIIISSIISSIMSIEGILEIETHKISIAIIL